MRRIRCGKKPHSVSYFVPVKTSFIMTLRKNDKNETEKKTATNVCREICSKNCKPTEL